MFGKIFETFMDELCNALKRKAQFENEMENDEFILPGETNKEVGLATLKTIESLKGAETTQKALGKEMPSPTHHIMLQALGSGYTAEQLCVKCAIFLIKIHHGVLTSSHQYLNIVEQLRTRCMDTVEKLRNNVGFNLAGFLKLIRRQIEEQNDVILFTDATQKLTSNEAKKT
ncbi:unnamed protein product [Rotaria sp. Silwood1]|nr:unnamed protein product [Rotaria sp. Silwood1]